MINTLEHTNEVRALPSNGASEGAFQSIYVTTPEVEVKSAKEAYYRWLSRLVILLTIISLSFFVASSLVLFKLAPQVTVEPFLFISQDRSENIVRYEPIKQDMASSRQIMEMFVRQYIVTRNTVLTDEREMQSRWFGGGLINYLSSPEIFSEFESKEVKVNLPKFLKKGLVREVEIDSVVREGGEKSRAWKVKFRTYDLYSQGSGSNGESRTLVVKHWTASLQAVFVPSRSFLARRLINPLGFTVIHYSQSEER